jgi:predicted secreted protein
MASVINGTNIVLYAYQNDVMYYFNGGVEQGTFAGSLCYQMARNQIDASSANLTKTGNGVICSFITNSNEPNVTSIDSGTWPISFYASLSGDLSGSPKMQVELYKYNGTTATLINVSSDIVFMNTAKYLYTSSINIPGTSLASTDRLLVKFIAAGIGTRTVTIYTQADNQASIQTNLEVGTPFGAATNCSLDISVGQVEVTSQASAWFKEYKNDVASWSVKCDGFITLSPNYNYAYLVQLQLSRAPLTIKFVIDNDNGTTGTLGDTVLTGVANLTSLSLSGPVEGASTYSVSLQGTGAYTMTGIEVSPTNIIIGGSTVKMFDYTAAGGESSITWLGAIGLTCISVTRGGIEVRVISSVGAPSGENVTFNTSTGVLTFARVLESDEFVRAILK